MPRSKDLIGQTFGSLIVLGREPNDKYHNAMFLCLCTCGNTLVTRGTGLSYGNTLSCGHHRTPTKDITDQVFGCLTALKPISRVKGRATKWLCLCSCGNYTEVLINKLMSGTTKSCGHLAKDALDKGRFKHGMSDTRAYRKLYRRRSERRGRYNDLWCIEDETQILNRFPCALCGSTSNLEVDHLLPARLGYGLSIDNMVVLCRSCNASKSGKYITELPRDKRQRLIEAFCEIQDFIFLRDLSV